MGWFSNLFKRKEKETQPIASPKVMSSTEDIREPIAPKYNVIVRDFQGKFIKGNPYNIPRDSKTGKFIKRK